MRSHRAVYNDLTGLLLGRCALARPPIDRTVAVLRGVFDNERSD